MNEVWAKIFKEYNISNHDFEKSPFLITGKEIKTVSRHFPTTTQREVRCLCKQDTREQRPEVFKQHNLFLLPVTNRGYCLVKGEGYLDVPEIKETVSVYKSKLAFNLETSVIGNSEMQHLDFAYAASLVRTFMEDDSLVLTIRGRHYTPRFNFYAGEYKSSIEASSVQTEVDAGYEGKDKVVLIEAKNSNTNNVIIRQLYYPYRQWKHHTTKEVVPLFFEKRENCYQLWQFKFLEPENYNSITLVKSKKFKIE